MSVDRCVCHSLAFAELIEIARERSLDFDALSQLTGCSSSCGFCEPYVKLALKTGRTRFPVLDNPDIDIATDANPGDGHESDNAP